MLIREGWRRVRDPATAATGHTPGVNSPRDRSPARLCSPRPEPPSVARPSPRGRGPRPDQVLGAPAAIHCRTASRTAWHTAPGLAGGMPPPKAGLGVGPVRSFW